MLDKKQILASIASIGKTATKLRTDVQAVLCSINEHVLEFGEVSLYAKLLDATKGANRVAIHRWIAENGGAVMRNEKLVLNNEWLKEHRNGAKTPAECLEARATYHDYVEANPLPLWYEEYQKDEDADVTKVWDAVEKAEALITACAKKAKNGGADAAHTDLERYLREALEKYKAEQIGAPAAV